MLDLSFDAEGNPLPTGHYRIAYVNGCMKFGAGQSFTVHAYEPSADAAAPAYASWTLVNADAGMQPVRLPGYWIFGDGGDTRVGTFPDLGELRIARRRLIDVALALGRSGESEQR